MQQDELKCIACGYDLRGQSSGSVFPECGEAVLYAIIGARDPALFKRESGMLRKQSSLAAALSHRASVSWGTGPAIDGLGIFVSLGNAAFWSAMAYAFHARLMHCQSIRVYRRLVNRRFRGRDSSSE